jgi:hypothetical protein
MIIRDFRPEEVLERGFFFLLLEDVVARAHANAEKA